MEIKKKLCWLVKPWKFLIKRLRILAGHLNTPRKKIIFGGIFLLVFLGIYFFSALINVSPAEIALAELNKSFKEETICHEECYLWRQEQEKIVALSLKNGSNKLANRILAYWSDAKENFDFKTELVKIMLLAYGKNNPPGYLNDYVADSDANQKLVREILSSFDLEVASNQNLINSLNNTISSAATSTEKVEAIKTLGKVGGDSEIDSYFLLLSSAEDIKVKKQAIKNISNILEKSKYFTLEQLAIIKPLILAPETNLSLRQELVLLVGDYYLVYPEESEMIWRNVYENEAQDSISRLFSADNLNHLAGTELELPAVSQAEWADYYNQ